MFETLKRLYNASRLTQAGLQNAVTKGWITQEEYDLIVNEPE
jgi:hypothetical protein